MLKQRLEDGNEADIAALITNQVSEGKTLEYKEALPGTDNEEKSEFLRDASAFANASGGDIIYGVSEFRVNNKPTGIPERIIGLDASTLDGEILRLEQVLRTGLEPRIPELRLYPVPLASGKKLLVIRIGDSWLKPHHICFKASPRYYIRTSAGKQPLDYQEVREAFLQSAELPKRMRAFRDQRLSTILSGDLLYELPPGPVMVTHFLPLESFRQQHQVDLAQYLRERKPFPMGIGISGWQRPNLDGVVFFNLGGGEIGSDMCGYSQLFHSGAIEIVDAFTIHEQGEHGKIIGTTALEKSLCQATKSAIECLKDFGITSDVYLFHSIMHIKGFRLYEQGPSRYGLPKQVDRNHLLFPEIQIDLDGSFEVPLKKLCDLFWQAFGARESPNFSELGHWTGG